MAQPSDSGILDALDQRPATAFYWKLSLLATPGGFLFGHDTSDTGSALNSVPCSLHGLALDLSRTREADR
jgi:MFS transporter, SP family, arabinose:H+ symporter